MIFTKVVASSKYTHPQLGPVNVRVVPTARSIHARWEGETMRVTVPRGLPLDTYEDFIEKNIPRFLEMKPAVYFRIGQVIDAGEVEFRIISNDFPGRNDGILITTTRDNLPEGRQEIITINVPPHIASEKMDSPAAQNLINKALLKFAAKATATYIIPRARQLAEQVGRRPAGWTVKHKKRSLGTCDQNGIICLSPRLIFLPPYLRDFVILHELAHLSEMNHSAAFHTICNAYCGGHEKEYTAALRTFHFPVF